MQALLIRHGRTPGNEERRYIGRTDEPLSERGRAEAEHCRKNPKQRLVYVSPYLRARETAKILFPDAEQIIVPGLRETDFGIFEGKNADEMADDPEYRAWVDSWCMGPIPGGESREEVTRRTVRSFSTAVRSAMEKGEDCAVFVTHGGVIMSLLSELARPQRDYYDYQTRNLEGWIAECMEEDGEIRLLNPQRLSLKEEQNLAEQ